MFQKVAPGRHLNPSVPRKGHGATPMRFRLAIVAALAVSITAANADQLDEWCAQAKLPSSIALCSDPELRALAIERQQAFDEARAGIGEERAHRLLNDQKGWIASYPKACGIAPNVPPPLPLAPDIQDCMARAGRARIAYLHSYGGPAQADETPRATAGQRKPTGPPTAVNSRLAVGRSSPLPRLRQPSRLPGSGSPNIPSRRLKMPPRTSTTHGQP